MLLRTDILQKRVVGCPCCFYLGYVHTISNSFSCRHEKLSSTVSNVVCCTQSFLESSRNAPPLWEGALRDDAKNGCVADYIQCDSPLAPASLCYTEIVPKSPFLEGGQGVSRHDFTNNNFAFPIYETNFYVFTIFKFRGCIKCQKRYVSPIL